MPALIILAIVLALTMGGPDETLRRYGAAERVWHLVSLNGTPVETTATITFPRRYQITGQGPCNIYNSTNTTPYPWIALGPIVATKRACPELQIEAAFFRALSAASIVVIDGDSLTLSTEDATLMIFKAHD